MVVFIVANVERMRSLPFYIELQTFKNIQKMGKENTVNEPTKAMPYDALLGTVIYLVMVCSGQYEDYTERHMFATADKDTAEKWRDKYNRIIDNNKDRINHYYDDQDWSKPEPFWYDEINWDLPTAQVREVEFR